MASGGRFKYVGGVREKEDYSAWQLGAGANQLFGITTSAHPMESDPEGVRLMFAIT